MDLLDVGRAPRPRESQKNWGITYIDSGAMYRAVTLYFLRHDIPFESPNDAISQALERIHISFGPSQSSGACPTFLNGQWVEAEIRSPEVSSVVSKVSVHKEVREEMVRQQQRMGAEKGVVMDGRDIGTVVFPHAELKIFMTADPEIRARRRLIELKEKGIEISLEKVLENLLERDNIDSTRAISPLKKAKDAIEIDTTELDIGDQIRQVVELAKERINHRSSFGVE